MDQRSDAPNAEPMDLDPVHPLAAFDMSLEEPNSYLPAPNNTPNQYTATSYEATNECAKETEMPVDYEQAACADISPEIQSEEPSLQPNPPPESIPTPADVPPESNPTPSEPVDPQEATKPPAKSRKSKANTEEDQSESFHTGQRHPEPSLDDPSRAFYESLLQQNPKSEMAIKYCLDHGLVPETMIDEMMTALTKLKRDSKKKTGV